MSNGLIVVLWTLVLFVAIGINVTVRKNIKKLLVVVGMVTAATGTILYGYGYASIEPDIPIAIMKTAYAVCGLFVGQASLSNISSAPFYENVPLIVQVVFWFLHILGLITTVGAAIAAFGSAQICKLRIRFSRRKELAIIYGVYSESVTFARNLAESNHTLVVFVSEEMGSQEGRIAEMGAIFRDDTDALKPNRRFLKSIGIRSGKRRISLYTLKEDPVQNYQYAVDFCKACEESEIDCEQISLTILSEYEGDESNLMVQENQYGYNTVLSVDIPYMASRVMIREYPPVDTLSFDENACAKEDFKVLVVGFGLVGQEVLRQLVMNGQFKGSQFEATVFDPNFEQSAGRFIYNYAPMFEHYPIHFQAYDGRSQQMYTYLREYGKELKYIVICTGNDKVNIEIEQQIYRQMRGRKQMPIICRLNHNEVIRRVDNSTQTKHSIYSPETLSSNQIDKPAMMLNQSYCQGNGLDAEENWKQCDYFSRMSSRASADFAPVFLKMTGTTEEQIQADGWDPQGEVLENLAQTEHLRWNAFHFSMGFDTMSDKMYERRIEMYQKEMEEKGNSRIRIGKDMEHKKHACLIGWEELDALSARENAITGGTIDYKEIDRNNVRSLVTLL